MKLTKVERWILSNQMRIMEALYPDEAKYIAENREAIERGFALHYKSMSEHIYDDEDTLSENECMEVVDILSMFDSMRYSFDQLKDQKDINEHNLNFLGFDGNDNMEGKYMAYSRYYCESGGGRFDKVAKGDVFNSHSPTLDMYRRMLKEWKKSDKKYQLTKEDIIRICNAKAYKE